MKNYITNLMFRLPQKTKVWLSDNVLWRFFKQPALFFYAGHCHICGGPLRFVGVYIVPGNVQESKEIVSFKLQNPARCPYCNTRIERVAVYKSAEAMVAGNQILHDHVTARMN